MGNYQVDAPDYEGDSITRIPGLIRDALTGSRIEPLSRLLPAQSSTPNPVRVVHFLIDGFGQVQWNNLKRHVSIMQAFESAGAEVEIDTVFPSSTPVALTSYYSGGQNPAEHGLTDWWLYIEEIDDIIVTLPFRRMRNEQPDSLIAEAAPTILYNGKTFFELLASQKVASYTFIRDMHAASTYSTVTFKGSTIVPFVSASDLVEKVCAVLTSSSDPCYLYVYWGDVDQAGHMHGPDSSEYKDAAYFFFDILAGFIDNLDRETAENTLAMISSDHGQITVDPSKALYLDDIDGFDALLSISSNGNRILPWGGTREVFIKVDDIDKAFDLLNKELDGIADVILIDDAIEMGLFGKPKKIHPHFRSRVGDIVILPRGNQLIWYRHPGEKPVATRGQHGGLSRQELAVPLALGRVVDLQSASYSSSN